MSSMRLTQRALACVLAIMALALSSTLVLSSAATATTSTTTTAAVASSDPTAGPTDTPSTTAEPAVKPVANDDTYTQFYPGNTATLPVLANDTDPMGRPLQICALKTTSLDISGVPGDNTMLEMNLDRSTHGTISVLYSVTATNCDDTASQASANLTIVVQKAKLRVSIDHRRHGYIKLVNTSKMKSYFGWGPAGSDPSHLVKVKPHKTVFVNVGKTHKVSWYSYFKSLNQKVCFNDNAFTMPG